MRIKRILWVIIAFAFVHVLYAQHGGTGGAAQTQPQTQNPQSDQQNANDVQMQLENQRAKSKPKAEGPVPLSEKELMKEIKNSPPETVIKEVNDRGVDFDWTPDKEKKLRKAKATDAEIDAVKQMGPKVRAHMAKMIIGTSSQNIPKDEAQAFEALKSELDPDKAVTLAQDFIQKYPNSSLISYVYYFGANGYQQKGDVEKVVEYCDNCLKTMPDNLMCLVTKVSMLPQPQYLNAHEMDRDKILQEAQTEGGHALQLIAQLPKKPNEADADYQKRLADIATEIHGPLGMVHLDLATGSLEGTDKTELAKAEQEFQASVTNTEHPDPRDYFRMAEAYQLDGKLDDAIAAFTKASELGQGSAIKTLADQRIEILKKAKAARAAGPAAPTH